MRILWAGDQERLWRPPPTSFVHFAYILRGNENEREDNVTLIAQWFASTPLLEDSLGKS